MKRLLYKLNKKTKKFVVNSPKPFVDVDFGVSICITAYKTPQYIEECLDSIAKQTWFNTHDKWEVILGIDDCQETLEKVKSIMGKYKNLKVLMMDSNNGTYITSNTVMKQAKYEWLIRFDSDDIMHPDMVEMIMKRKGSAKFVRYYLYDFDKEVRKRNIAYGSVCFNKEIFEKFGGYMPWVCSADSEMIARLRGRVPSLTIRNALYDRRLRPESLIHAKETDFKSEIRKKYGEYIKGKSRKHPVIDCVTNTFTVIQG